MEKTQSAAGRGARARKSTRPLLKFFAVSAPGLEPMLAAELRSIGIRCVVEEGGVSFSGGMRELFRANMHLRIASRVIVRAARFHATAFHQLERNAKRVHWDDFLPAGAAVRLRVTCRKSRLYHSDAVAERIANVLAERSHAVVSESVAADADDAEPPAVDSGAGVAAQMFVVRLFHDRCSISADSSGKGLHFRGYREATGKAPLRETLAAALLRASEWTGELPLMDPMCGSGTIAIEAALAARRIAPALSRAGRIPRDFSFQNWPGFDAALWETEVDAARANILERAPIPILASDRDAGAIAAALSNALRAGVSDDIDFAEKAISAMQPPAGAGAVVCNPPYGKRVGEEKALRDLYARLGSVLKTRFRGWSVTMLSGNRMLETGTALRFSVIARTSNGGIPVRILRAVVQ